MFTALLGVAIGMVLGYVFKDQIQQLVDFIKRK